jgi:hypothetical protein
MGFLQGSRHCAAASFDLWWFFLGGKTKWLGHDILKQQILLNQWQEVGQQL